MFLTTTPEGKIYKELATDHFADPTGLGKYALFLRPSQGDIIPAPQMEPSLLLSGRYRPVTLEGRNLFVSRGFYAFYKHLEEHGIEARMDMLFSGGLLTSDSGVRATNLMMDQGVRPDAIICLNDAMALGALHQL